MRTGLLSICLLFSFSAPAGIYKWTDAEGNVHYGDRPVADSEAVELRSSAVPATRRQPAEAGETAAPDEPVPTTGLDYAVFEFASPENNETFRTDSGEIPIGLFIEPPLNPDHQLRINVDGMPLQGDFRSTQLILKDLPRGSHRLGGEILDGNGNVIARTPLINFHIRRAPAEQAAEN